ncbi:MAG: hypothetical protein JW891_11420 [Candidatus Lokiarchaeota archaeon]|nr:hypothetical protein [Candidatus Lokiarchaeota archaeon]
MTLNSTEKKIDEFESTRSKRTQYTLEIAGAAIFGALSLIISALTTPYLVRVPGWGIAVFEFIAIIWIACFYIFGPRAGVLSLIIGAFTLLPFDTNQYGWIGPVMKFAATIPLIIVPVLILKLYKSENGSKILKKPKNFALTSVLSILVRCFLMFLVNVAVFMIVTQGYVDFVNLEIFGMPEINGWMAIFIGSMIINLYQSVFDLVIPYLLVFGIKGYGLQLDEKFEIW